MPAASGTHLADPARVSRGTRTLGTGSMIRVSCISTTGQSMGRRNISLGLCPRANPRYPHRRQAAFSPTVARGKIAIAQWANPIGLLLIRSDVPVRRGVAEKRRYVRQPSVLMPVTLRACPPQQLDAARRPWRRLSARRGSRSISALWPSCSLLSASAFVGGQLRLCTGCSGRSR